MVFLFYMNNGNGYRVEKSNGVFGKTAGDSSAKMVIVPAGDGQNQGNPFISEIREVFCKAGSMAIK